MKKKTSKKSTKKALKKVTKKSSLKKKAASKSTKKKAAKKKASKKVTKKAEAKGRGPVKKTATKKKTAKKATKKKAVSTKKKVEKAIKKTVKKKSAVKSVQKKTVSKKKVVKKAKPATKKKVAKKKATKKKASRKKATKVLKAVAVEFESIDKKSEISSSPAIYQNESNFYYKSLTESRELPQGYGDHFIHTMVRDPEWIYVYWEIQEHEFRKGVEYLGGDDSKVKFVLRVFEKSTSENDFHYSDLEVNGLIQNWYINTQPNFSYFMELGVRHEDGRYYCLVKSNETNPPRMSMSEVLDEEWMSLDFEKMYALSGGFQVGLSSEELTQAFHLRQKESVTSGSGGFSSPSKAWGKDRNFWFVLDCEVIVYGATEPDAKVTLQGKPVNLRPDGTFSARFSLPDGEMNLEATAQSADGIEERRIIPIVHRVTHRPEPVIQTEV